jgi:hypothetical protein
MPAELAVLADVAASVAGGIAAVLGSVQFKEALSE